MTRPRTEAQRAAERKYRHSGNGREMRSAQSRRWRERHPAKATARVELLKFHGARLAAQHADPSHVPPVASLAETANIAKRALWVQASAAAEAGDPDGADRLYREANLMAPPVPRPDTGSPLVAADSDDGDAAFDWLDDFGPHA
jgi:hypothetical protein